jgi:formate hydrogenlyase subunit 3/multisubunit Na+/H+ antiporter MnhD subunit
VIFVAIHLAPREPLTLWSCLLAGMAGAAVAIFAGTQSAWRPKTSVQSFRRARARNRA